MVMTCHQRTKLVNSNKDFSDDRFRIHSRVLHETSLVKNLNDLDDGWLLPLIDLVSNNCSNKCLIR